VQLSEIIEESEIVPWQENQDCQSVDHDTHPIEEAPEVPSVQVTLAPP
jgi:hypothetical protein